MHSKEARAFNDIGWYDVPMCFVIDPNQCHGAVLIHNDGPLPAGRSNSIPGVEGSTLNPGGVWCDISLHTKSQSPVSKIGKGSFEGAGATAGEVCFGGVEVLRSVTGIPRIEPRTRTYKQNQYLPGSPTSIEHLPLSLEKTSDCTLDFFFFRGQAFPLNCTLLKFVLSMHTPRNSTHP